MELDDKKPVIDIGKKNTKRLMRGLTIVELSVMVLIPIALYTIDYLCGYCIR